MIGTTLQDRYRLEAELGQGGVGVVYRAHDLRLNRSVAVKLLSTTSLSATSKERLLVEAQAAARLNHPNIVAVHDAGEAYISGSDASIPFIIMELVQGDTLRAYRSTNSESSEGPLDSILAIARQICAALEHAHANGIIHRDLKPENILITTTKQVKLMDFGLARTSNTPHLTEEGAIVGTFSYLAPELILGQPATPQSDLYALGVMLYELTAGRPPFSGENLMAVFSQHLHAPVVPASTYHSAVPPWLDALIGRLLSKQPEDRPASISDVRWVLEQYTTNMMSNSMAESSLLDRLVRGRLVGREREFGEARAQWRRAITGEGGVLLISGEPGIGKTRLTREITALAEVSGAAILSGECYAEGGAPYHPIAQMVRQLFTTPHTIHNLPLPDTVMADLIAITPELQARYPHVPPNSPLDAQAEQQRLFESVVGLCVALNGRSPILLVLEDAHWADGGSLFLLRHLARRARSTRLRLLIALTYRETELDESRALNDVLFDLTRERLGTRLKLARFSYEQTRDLVTTMLNAEVSAVFLNNLYRETEGNPFFVEEVCKALIEEGKLSHQGGQWHTTDTAEIQIPQSVRVAIQSRIAKFPTQVQDILNLAAIIGREFDVALLQRAGELDEDTLIDALETAEHAQLISEVRHRKQETFAFAHALIPTTLSENLSSLRRTRLHRRVATAIESLHPEDFESLAHHYGQAGNEECARHYHIQAGNRALAAYANQDAENHYRAVLELDGSDEEQAQMLSNLGETLSRQSNYQAAGEIWRKAIALYRKLGDVGQSSWLYARLGRATSYSGDLPGALATCQEGLITLTADGRHRSFPDSVGVAALLHEAARASYFNGLADEAHDLCQQALVMAERLDARRVQAETLATMGILPGQTAESAMNLLRRSATLAETNHFLETAARAYNNLANAYEEAGDLAGARENYLKAAEFCRRRGSVSEELFVLSQVVDILFWLGDFAAAEKVLADLRELTYQAKGFAAGVFSVQQSEAMLCRYRGELEEATSRLKVFCQEAERLGEKQQLTLGNFYLAEIYLEQKEWAVVRQVLTEGIPDKERLGRRGIWAHCLLSVAYAHLGQLVEAEAELSKARAVLGEDVTRFDESYLWLAEGHLAWGNGRLEQAISSFEAVVKAQTAVGLRWYRAQTQQTRADVYLACGEREKAQALLQQALVAYVNMSATHYVTAVQQKLQLL